MIDAEEIDALVIDSARDYSHLPSVQHLARVAPMYQTYAINACADLAERMGAHYYGLYDLSRDEIATAAELPLDRKRTRLNSSHLVAAYPEFCTAAQLPLDR